MRRDDILALCAFECLGMEGENLLVIARWCFSSTKFVGFFVGAGVLRRNVFTEWFFFPHPLHVFPRAYKVSQMRCPGLWFTRLILVSPDWLFGPLAQSSSLPGFLARQITDSFGDDCLRSSSWFSLIFVLTVFNSVWRASRLLQDCELSWLERCTLSTRGLGRRKELEI